MIYSDINQVDVGVYDKVREYYKVDKKLGGLIKVFVSVHVARLGRTIQIVIPQLDREDVININGLEYTPNELTKLK